MLLLCTSLYSQIGKIIYVKYKTVAPVNGNAVADDPTKGNLDIYANVLESIEYELFASDYIGIFAKTQKMEADKPHPLEKLMGNGVYYTDLKSRIKIKQIELGEKFNVSIPFEEYKWEISSESKMINGFKCYKATSHKETYIKWKNKLSITNPEVWFSPEIPFSYGPFGLIGLPGLVLEATLNGKVYYHATKIDLDYKEISRSKLEMPTKGKSVTESEMEEIQIKMIPEN